MPLPVWLRGYASLPIRSIPIRLRAGPNAGAKWSLAASPRRYRAGTYEADRFETIRRLVKPGDVFWDVGAHFGYASLLAGRLVGGNGQVVCVEPSSYNRMFLKKHLRWNDIEGTVLSYALGEHDRTQVQFGGERTSVTFRVGQGSEIVTVRTLPSLLQETKLRPPTVLKIDAEGSEAGILRGAESVLSPHMALLVSIHSYDNYNFCKSFLRERGFAVLQSRELPRHLHLRTGDWPRDPDLLAFGSQRHFEPADFDAWFGPADEI